MQEIRPEYVHRGQTYLTASHSQLRYFLISRRDGENNGFLAGVPLLPRAWSRALIPFPFPFERLPRRLAGVPQGTKLGPSLFLRGFQCGHIKAHFVR